MTSSEIEEIRVILEKDLTWRRKELSFLQSLLNEITGVDNTEIQERKNLYRKSLVLALYAHFEGYFRYSFETYAMAINEAKLEIGKVIEVLFVSSLNKEFISYDDANKWITSADEELTKNSKKLFNRIELVKNIENSKTTFLRLPLSSNFTNKDKTSVVHTESNLKPAVIDKILYSLGIHQKLGLEVSAFLKLMGLVSDFVKKRNGIAHGDNSAEYKNGLSEKEFEGYWESFNKIVSLIAPIITHSLEKKLYLKPQFR
jgi:hypothetical protein